MKKRIAIALSFCSLAVILFFTLRESGEELRSWSFYLTAGVDALAALLQNIILFIPLGAALTRAGVRPYLVVALGGLVSFTVEFLQQWIPGRDPSLGDIVCNTLGTALGVLLVVAAPLWLWAPPRRSVWQARLTALIAVVVWYGTGLMLQQSFPPPPYHVVNNPSLNHFGYYKGKVLKVTMGDRSLDVVAIAAPHPPGRSSPLIAVVNPNDETALMLSVDGPDLTLRYDMPALRWTLEQPDLRFRSSMKPVAPLDTFTAAVGFDSTGHCLHVNATARCHLGYTIGDGWKLIYYPEGARPWQLGILNTLWMAGCVIGVGFWAARGNAAAKEAAATEAAAKGGGGLLAMGLIIAALLMVPLMTGLKPTPVYEWFGALGGMAVGWWLARVSVIGH